MCLQDFLCSKGASAVCRVSSRRWIRSAWRKCLARSIYTIIFTFQMYIECVLVRHERVSQSAMLHSIVAVSVSPEFLESRLSCAFGAYPRSRVVMAVGSMSMIR